MPSLRAISLATGLAGLGSMSALTLAALLVGPAIPAHAWGGGIRLARKFQPGMVTNDAGN